VCGYARDRCRHVAANAARLPPVAGRSNCLRHPSTAAPRRSCWLTGSRPSSWSNWSTPGSRRRASSAWSPAGAGSKSPACGLPGLAGGRSRSFDGPDPQTGRSLAHVRFEGQSGLGLSDGVRSALFPFRLKGSLEPTSGRHFGSPSRPFRQLRRWREHLLLSWRRSSRRPTDCRPQQQPVSQRPQPSH